MDEAQIFTEKCSTIRFQPHLDAFEYTEIITVINAAKDIGIEMATASRYVRRIGSNKSVSSIAPP